MEEKKPFTWQRARRNRKQYFECNRAYKDILDLEHGVVSITPHHHHSADCIDLGRMKLYGWIRNVSIRFPRNVTLNNLGRAFIDSFSRDTSKCNQDINCLQILSNLGCCNITSSKIANWTNSVR